MSVTRLATRLPAKLVEIWLTATPHCFSIPKRFGTRQSARKSPRRTPKMPLGMVTARVTWVPQPPSLQPTGKSATTEDANEADNGGKERIALFLKLPRASRLLTSLPEVGSFVRRAKQRRMLIPRLLSARLSARKKYT